MVKKAAYIAIPVFFILALLAVKYLPGVFSPRCIFHSLTGYYCTGCGGTRAAMYLLRGDILAALRYNAYFVALLPVALYFYAAGFFRIVLNKKILPVPRRAAPWLWALLGLTVVFMVVRNIEIFPFTLLKP